MSDSLMGPSYNYADELATPSELGIGNDGSVEGITKAIAGVNYYTDAIGFGESTMLAKAQGWDQRPLGVRYFTKTGATCSNGAPMYEYIDTTPPGLPGRVGVEIRKTLGVDLKGLGPGIMYDAVGALNPMPMVKAIMGSIYAKCKKVTLPVGDLRGNLRPTHDGKPWITEADTTFSNGVPVQTRWIYDSDLTQKEYDETEKTELTADQKATMAAAAKTEGFRNRYKRARSPGLAAAAGAALLLVLGTFWLTRKPTRR